MTKSTPKTAALPQTGGSFIRQPDGELKPAAEAEKPKPKPTKKEPR